MNKFIEWIIYIPIGVKLSKQNRIFLIIWAIVSLAFFCILTGHMNSEARGIFFMYFGGIISMFLSFQDTEYVQNKLKNDFSSLLWALYKQNIIFFAFFVLMILGDAITVEKALIVICSVGVYWCLSIPMAIIYEIKELVVYAIAVFFISLTFLYVVKIFEVNYEIAILINVLFVAITVFISKKRIRKYCLNSET